MKKVFFTVLLILSACNNGDSVNNIKVSSELPPDLTRMCYYGSHSNPDGKWHELKTNEYHCHYWRKSTCKETHDGQEVVVPCWVEEFPSGQ